MVTRLIMVIIFYLIYLNVESLCFTPETNIILYVNYASVFLKKYVSFSTQCK